MPRKMLPQFVEPMQASSVQEPFDSLDWIFETKLDGYRAIAVINPAGKARIWSRNRLPFEPKFPMVLHAVDQLKLRSTILDGEIVALDSEGIPRFSVAPTMAETPNCTGCLFTFSTCFGVTAGISPPRPCCKAVTGWSRSLLRFLESRLAA